MIGSPVLIAINGKRTVPIQSMFRSPVWFSNENTRTDGALALTDRGAESATRHTAMKATIRVITGSL